MAEVVDSSQDSQLRPQKRQMLVDGVYEQLVTLLMSGALPPGDPIGIDDLSRDLQVSPTPIREALARIEATGLIVREPLRGYRAAARMSLEDFRQLTEARLLIEPYNAAAACGRRSEELLHELSGALDQMRRAPTGAAYEEFRVFLDADARFHGIISKYAGNRFLTEALARLGAQQHRFRLFREGGPTDSVPAIAEHQAVFDAIQQGSPVLAQEAMKRHIQGVLQRVVYGNTSSNETTQN